ncbi:MAG TPA: lysylphosphatidylglycerol synthase transmembrane domain-containing protein [Candidatus Omnitrophota bacterium]|nr:lysylphosphatidylglycerol synthase transmembrane domain-containing protein [Candidatus Omnitrophota bacterium]
MVKTFISILISVLILAAIFSQINLAEFRTYLSEMDVPVFILAVLFFAPLILVSAWRWQIMIAKWAKISLWESTKLIFACAALNILLPSRVGDLSKGYFAGKAGGLDIKRGMNIVFFEKYIDFASLGIVVLTGVFLGAGGGSATVLALCFSLGVLAVFPLLYFVRFDRWFGASIFQSNKILSKLKGFFCDTQAYLDEIKNDGRYLGAIIAISIGLWFLHLLQFYFVFKALHSVVTLFRVFELVPLAILVGLIPITMAGVGTRDSAMIYFFSPYEKVPVIAGVALLSSLRYFVPGFLGLFFLNQYIVKEPSK